MDTRRHWIGFDTFKLIVAIILLLLLLVLLLQKPAVSSATNAGQANEVGVTAASQTPLPSTAAPSTATQPPQPSLTPTTVLPTATLPPAPTPSLVPPTATPAPTESLPTATPTAEAAATATPAATPTATLQPAAAAGGCPLAQPSRLAVGKQAVVLANLNLRKEAGVDQPILRVSLPTSRVEVIGGPVCIPYQKGAYMWWNVKTTDGVTGWSAEASLSKNFYFLQPVP